MRFKKMALALFACMAVAALSANAAQANWTIGSEGEGPGTVLSGSETVEVSGSNFTLTAELLGAEFALTAEAVECGEGCMIDNTVSTNHSSGSVRFTGVTVDGLGECSVRGSHDAKGSNTITTEALTDEVIMDPSGGEAVFTKISVKIGKVIVTLEFGGAECAFDGLEVPVEGTVTGEVQHPTGYLAVEQTLTFGASQQSTGGGSLTLGEGAGSAVLDGTAHTRLTGSSEGEAYGPMGP